MSLGFSMNLSMSQSLALRQDMEARLEQSLLFQQKIALTLILYQKRENYLTALYKKALQRGDVKWYEKHGLKFEIALVRKKEVPDDILKQCGPAFSHALFSGFDAFFKGTKYALSRGSWLLFVVTDFFANVQPEFLEYWAVHERGEQVTLGNHNLATKLEFSIAAKEKSLKNYVKWLENNSPEHLANVFAYEMHLELPDDEEFQTMLHFTQQTDEAKLILQCIEEFQWPYSVLQKLTLYDKKNEEVKKIITGAANQALNAINYLRGDLRQILIMIRKDLIDNFKEMNDLRKYISSFRQNQTWQFFLKLIADAMAKEISRLGDIVNLSQAKKPDALQRYLDTLVELDIENKPLPNEEIFNPDFMIALNFALSK